MAAAGAAPTAVQPVRVAVGEFPPTMAFSTRPEVDGLALNRSREKKTPVISGFHKNHLEAIGFQQNSVQFCFKIVKFEFGFSFLT